MSDTSWKRNGELVHVLFDVLHARGTDGMPAGEAIQEMGKQVGLTSFEAGHYTDGSRRFDKILRFATIAPVKARWLVKEGLARHGAWRIASADGSPVRTSEY